VHGFERRAINRSAPALPCVGRGASLDRIPVAKGATIEQALHGGEDYELLFTSPKPLKLPGIFDIGTIVKGKPGLILLNGNQLRPAGLNTSDKHGASATLIASMKMMKTVLSLLMLTAAAFGQYTAAPAKRLPLILPPP